MSTETVMDRMKWTTTVVLGLLSGTMQAAENHQQREASIYRACLAARGYTTGG
jgi:hypothetical protein